MKNKKQSGSTCNDCTNIDRSYGRCLKYHCPLPVNINLQFLRCLMCIEDGREKDEGKSKT